MTAMELGLIGGIMSGLSGLTGAVGASQAQKYQAAQAKQQAEVGRMQADQIDTAYRDELSSTISSQYAGMMEERVRGWQMRGTVVGEAVRSATQFKSFPMTFYDDASDALSRSGRGMVESCVYRQTSYAYHYSRRCNCSDAVHYCRP